jgi:amino acid adenylation domain-containing protein
MNDLSASPEAQLTTLSDERTRLLTLLLEQETQRSQTIKPYPRDSQTSTTLLPTSPAQQRLWFIDQLEGGSAGYFIPVALRLRGKLDPIALKRALDTLVQRHEVLRTVFVNVDGDPRQEIHSHGEFPLQLIDVGGAGSSERESRVEYHKAEEIRSKFDLRTGPLIRGRLLQLHAHEHVLLLTMHHIVSDGWSMPVFFRELAALYAAYAQGLQSPLAALPIQYGDYAQWQREWLQGEQLQRQMHYWAMRLAHTPPQLELPTDRPRPAIQSYRGANVALILEPGLTHRLRALAQRCEMTLFMVLCAGFAILLSRLSGQDDIVIGTPITNRQRPELEGLIGFFVNTLALRVQLNPELTIGEVLDQVKELTLGAYEHQDVPFEKVVETLQPERNLSRNPLFQTMLALHNVPSRSLALPGLAVASESGLDEPSIFDLFLSLEEQDDQVTGFVNYATDLFDRATVERWMACFIETLHSMSEDLQVRVGYLPILPQQERQQIFEAFNATQAAYPPELLIHQLFEEQVQRTPHAIAAIHGGEQLTYAQLNARANQLGRLLVAKGIGPDRLVAISMERGLEMLIGLLGILKAGGAYVPLDPAYPAERIAYVLEDAAPTVLLTHDRLRGRFAGGTAEIIAIDSAWHQIAQLPDGNLEPAALHLNAHHLAYVIYTSGSTGTPKGVAIEHRNTVNLIQWARSAVTTREIFSETLQSTSLNFDLSVYECFVTLCVGGCVRVMENALALLNEATHVTLINTVPSAMAAILESGAIPASTRVVNLAGEVLKKELVDRIFANRRVERVCNLYGPSETTTYSTWIAMRRETGFNASIGRPISNTQIYILDSAGQIVPIGVVGEIYIGGAGVARGYLHKPELTAERFQEDPYSTDPQARLYKTGDRGRWRADGTIEYLGRADHQVKIRGFRIELGEIEAQIASHEKIKEAVVLAREDIPGEKRLVAYVVGTRAAAAQDSGKQGSASLRETVLDEWQGVWAETYQSQAEVSGPTFTGWNSSYTGQPIPETDMQEWLTFTIERVRTLKPGKVLEIGCGIGLLLQHLAPHCETYVGTDFSAAAIEQLRGWLGGRADLQHVRLEQGAATDIGRYESGSFDTIILNSVVQYFPDVEYLVSVLELAIRRLRPGGKIFLGDIRHYGLLSVFQSAVQLAKAAPNTTLGRVKGRVGRAIAEEKELLIDPRFFEHLLGRLPGVAAVDLELKRGHARNELTAYRYDVVLHTGDSVASRPVYTRLQWGDAIPSVAHLEACLRDKRWDAISLSNLPNRRLAEDMVAQRLVQESPSRAEVQSVRQQLGASPADGLDPELFWDLGPACGYDVQVTWGPEGSQGRFEVRLLERARASRVLQLKPKPDQAAVPWSFYASDPLEGSFRQQLVPELRDHVKHQLPEYMLPAAWVVLKELPRTPNGKVDRRALPNPQDRPDEAGEYIAPEGAVETLLAEIWAQILPVDRVGAQDNFFELGGHSLLGMKLIAKLNQRLGIHLPATAVFQHPTIRQMARLVESLQLLSAARHQDTQGLELEEGVL